MAPPPVLQYSLDAKAPTYNLSLLADLAVQSQAIRTPSGTDDNIVAENDNMEVDGKHENIVSDGDDVEIDEDGDDDDQEEGEAEEEDSASDADETGCVSDIDDSDQSFEGVGPFDNLDCFLDRSSKNINEGELSNSDPSTGETDTALVSRGINPDPVALVASLEGNPQSNTLSWPPKFRTTPAPHKVALRHRKPRHDFFASLSSYPELFLELAKHLTMPSLISLYVISKDFHETLNGHLSHAMKLCSTYHAPESAKVFLFTMYKPLCVPDPVGRPHPIREQEARYVPGLRWLQMVLFRERCVRDILACMARQGHRMPKGMALTLKKIWLTMDIATTRQRMMLMANKRLWTNQDLYNATMFFMKLDMRLNDPIDGPGDDGLRKLMLGQRSLSALTGLLKRTKYTTLIEVVEMGVRYAYIPTEEYKGGDLFGVPQCQIGKGHLEGWGKGRVHLLRPDELVIREAVRRGLNLDKHMIPMMLWGYVDPKTREDIKVSEEEMYMSDDDENGEEQVPGSGYSLEDSEWETDMEDGSN